MLWTIYRFTQIHEESIHLDSNPVKLVNYNYYILILKYLLSIYKCGEKVVFFLKETFTEFLVPILTNN